MVKLANVYKRLAPAKNLDKLAIDNQSTNDIIKQVLSQHVENVKEAKKICDLFEGGNLYQTSKNIWNFLKYEVPYKVEPSDKQTTKTISRMLFDAMTGKGNDCKHYSGFTGAVLEACGYKDWNYRFAGYSKYISVPTHVYCVANDGETIFIDAVINGFDLEKPYVLKIDKKIKKNMSLYKLSGVNDNDIYIGSWLSDGLKAVKKGASNLANFAGDKAKAAANLAVDLALKAKQALVTVSMQVPRNAFLLLMRANVRGWATGLKDKTFNDLKWWTDIGGDRGALMSAIKAGSKNARILGFDYNDTIYPSMIGGIGEPLTITAALASATPIIIKIESILDKAQKTADAANKLKTTTTKVSNTIEQAKKGFEQLTGTKVENVIFKKDAGLTGDRNGLTTTDLKPTSDADAQRVANAVVSKNFGSGFDNKTLLLIGGAGLALFLIMRKK